MTATLAEPAAPTPAAPTPATDSPATGTPIPQGPPPDSSVGGGRPRAGGLLEWVRTLAELRRRRRNERATEHRARADERAARQARRRAEHAAKAAARRARLTAALQAARPATPVVLVTVFAVTGQVGYGLDHYTPDTAPWGWRVLVAVGAAVTIESIATYVAWHAHDALLHKANGTAARLRRASYAIALVVAGINYAHFANPDMTPTPGAVVFGVFSASSPWLWGLHTRRAQQKQLLKEGNADEAGARFSAERWRAFPYRTWMARRYSIAHSITDPRVAWERSEAARHARRASRPTPVPAGVRMRVRDAVGTPDTGTDTGTGGQNGTHGQDDTGGQDGTHEPTPTPARPGPRPVPARTIRRRPARPPYRRPVAGRAPRLRPSAPTERPHEQRKPSPPKPRTGGKHRRLRAVDGDREADFIAWVAREHDGQRPTAYQVRQRYGCRQSVATRLLGLLDEPERGKAATG